MSKVNKFMRLKKSEITQVKNDLFHEGELKEKEIESIKFLKSRGFKIMKREFIEI